MKLGQFGWWRLHSVSGEWQHNPAGSLEESGDCIAQVNVEPHPTGKYRWEIFDWHKFGLADSIEDAKLACEQALKDLAHAILAKDSGDLERVKSQLEILRVACVRAYNLGTQGAGGAAAGEIYDAFSKADLGDPSVR